MTRTSSSSTGKKKGPTARVNNASKENRTPEAGAHENFLARANREADDTIARLQGKFNDIFNTEL